MALSQGKVSMLGGLSAKKISAPKAPIAWRIKNFFRFSFIWGLLAVYVGVPIAKALGLMTAYGTLRARLITADGRVIDYGLLGHRVVTTAFVQFLTDQLQVESTLIGDFKYHDSGVGVVAEAVGDTAIGTTDGEARATGTQAEGAANVYQSVGTISYTTTKAITEHGLFNDLTAGTLLDRTVFSAINVSNGDSIQFTYSLTITAGG